MSELKATPPNREFIKDIKTTVAEKTAYLRATLACIANKNEPNDTGTLQMIARNALAAIKNQQMINRRNKMSEEFEVGQQVLVSHDSISDAIESLTNTVTKFYYLHTLTTDAIAVRCVRADGTDYVSCYDYAVAMPEGENKMNEEFEIRQRVAVSNVSIEKALADLKKDSDKFYYLCALTDGFAAVRCVSPSGRDYVASFRHATAMPEGGIR